MFMKITFHNNLLLFIAILKLQTYKFEIKEKFTYFKVAHIYTNNLTNIYITIF